MIAQLEPILDYIRHIPNMRIYTHIYEYIRRICSMGAYISLPYTCVTSLHPEIAARTNCRTKYACTPPLHPEIAVFVVMFIAIQLTQPRIFFEEERSVYRKGVFSSVECKGHLKRAVIDSVAVLTKTSLMLPGKSFIFIIK